MDYVNGHKRDANGQQIVYMCDFCECHGNLITSVVQNRISVSWNTLNSRGGAVMTL